MARRAMWKGVVTFGAVSVPVKVYSAVREQRVNFHLLHDDDKVRLQQQMVCPVDDKPVPEEEQVKGLALDDDKYVLLDPQELEELAPEAGRSIDVLRFVEAGHFDERFYDRGYYLGADGPAGPYEALLAGAGTGRQSRPVPVGHAQTLLCRCTGQRRRRAEARRDALRRRGRAGPRNSISSRPR